MKKTANKHTRAKTKNKTVYSNRMISLWPIHRKYKYEKDRKKS